MSQAEVDERNKALKAQRDDAQREAHHDRMKILHAELSREHLQIAETHASIKALLANENATHLDADQALIFVDDLDGLVEQLEVTVRRMRRELALNPRRPA